MNKSYLDQLLTSLSSTASQPHSSRDNLPAGTLSGQGHGGTSGGSRPTCFYPECCQWHLDERRKNGYNDTFIVRMSLSFFLVSQRLRLQHHRKYKNSDNKQKTYI